jgi:O-acetyl-ADP-ribose deacetylase (regulator of RNase III)
MDTIKIRNTNIKVQHCDIVNLCVDAVVSPDSADFFMSKGAARAIVKASGVRVRQHIKLDRPIKVGDVVVTPGGTIPAKHIMHLAFMETDALEFDRKSVSLSIANCLARAEEEQYKTIGMPVFSSSGAVFPYEACAKIMISSIVEYFVQKDSNIIMVTIVVYDKEALGVFQKVFNSVRDAYLL